MNKWHDPARIIAEYFALAKFVHLLGGLYIWEFVTNLEYEYNIITGKRKLTRAFPLYLGCRWFPLLAIVVQFIGFDASTASYKDGCQAMVVMTFTFSYLSFLFSSALIILRISALWQHNKVVIALASAFWLTNLICSIYGVATYRGLWTGVVCAIQHTDHTKIGTFSTFFTDAALLVLMFIGVWRWEAPREKGGVWWLLYTQGLAWVIIITLAEVPPVVFIILDLNDTMNLMFLTPALIITAIGAARIHRGLVNYPRANFPPMKPVNNKEWSRDAKSSAKCTKCSEDSELTLTVPRV